jgi:RNA recognition motif-containing protein
MFNIYVGNLSFKTTEPDLQTLFEQHGAVQRASIVVDRQTGRPRGFGFVEMPNEAEGKAAIEALNNKEFQGRVLTVNEARPREPRNSNGPRSN